jgi:hypothetical protein
MMLRKGRIDIPEGRMDRLESIIIAGTETSSEDRILEKQNSSQMSQDFSCIRPLILTWSCFSRILREAASPNRRAAPNAALRSHISRALRCGLASD